MSLQEDITSIEADSEICRSNIAFGDALKRLRANKDFKKVIEQAYLHDNALRLVELLSAPQTDTEAKQRLITDELKAIGLLKFWFTYIEQESLRAEKQLEANDHSLEYMNNELLKEGDE